MSLCISNINNSEKYFRNYKNDVSMTDIGTKNVCAKGDLYKVI